MDEPPRAEQLPPGLTLGELRGERDIEVPVIAEVLLQVYLDERAAQPAGDLMIEHGGRTIPVRLDGQRPLTTTEQMAKQGKAPPLVVGGVVVLLLLILWLIVSALR